MHVPPGERGERAQHPATDEHEKALPAAREPAAAALRNAATSPEAAPAQSASTVS